MAVDRKEAFTGTQEVLEQHRVDMDKLQAYMESNVDGFSGSVSIQQFKGGGYEITTNGSVEDNPPETNSPETNSTG